MIELVPAKGKSVGVREISGFEVVSHSHLYLMLSKIVQHPGFRVWGLGSRV